MPSRVRRQHVVSRFYLNGFASDDGRVCRVALPGDARHVLSTGDAAVIKDFYTIRLPDGTQSDMFEHSFAEIEKAAAPALREMLEGQWPIAPQNRAALSSWIALQHLRGEQVRSSQGGLNAEMIKLVIGVSGKEALRKLIDSAESRQVSDDELDAEWRDITKPGGPDLIPDASQHVRTVMSLHGGMSAYLNDCHWTLFRFVRRSIVTTDHPVTLVAGRDRDAWEGIGIATAELFLVPLSRRVALTIQPRRRFEAFDVDPTSVPDFRVPGTTAIARTVNQTAVAHASRYVYHHPDDSPLESLRLPEPEVGQPQLVHSDNLIREEGLFHGMDESALQALQRPPGDESRGISIADIPWPIPGRRPFHPLSTEPR